MSTYLKIKKEKNQAMKDKDVLKKNLLSLVISRLDYQKVAELEGAEQEKAVQNILLAVRVDLRSLARDVYKRIDEGKATMNDAIQKEIDKTVAEEKILEVFLEKSLTNEDVQNIVDELVVKHGNQKTSKNSIMKELKAQYTGRYDGLFAVNYVDSKLI
jgi:uncharacterized protein YqeY